MRAKRVGLTGNIGAGKSTVARLLAAKGASLIDADELAREAAADPSVLAEISEKLGSDLVQDGRLERAKTARRVFGDAEALQTLNAIIHPWVRHESRRRGEALERSGARVILFDIPLLYENGLERELDWVIVVAAPFETRLERVVSRSQLSGADFRARDAAQWPLEAKVARADFVLDNSGSAEDLASQVEALWQNLLE